MLIGDSSLFTKDHYEAHKGVAPAHLCELVVHCLELVAQLASTDLQFRFKGGNSQLILLEQPERFSIDVDVVTTVEKPELIAVVERLTAGCDVFTRCEVRPHKTKPWLPMISFKLFFESVYQPPEDAYVMLDAVLEPAPYPGMRKAVRCGDLYRSDVEVEVPTLGGLVADKLLCIGPSTLGIPLGKKKEGQRLKHVFDVALLSGQPHDHDLTRTSLGAIIEQENRIQKSEWTREQVFEDTRKFCGLPLQHEGRPADELLEPGTYLDEIARGFDDFRHHPFRAEYTWPRFREDCGKILALLDELEGG